MFDCRAWYCWQSQRACNSGSRFRLFLSAGCKQPPKTTSSSKCEKCRKTTSYPSNHRGIVRRFLLWITRRGAPASKFARCASGRYEAFVTHNDARRVVRCSLAKRRVSVDVIHRWILRASQRNARSVAPISERTRQLVVAALDTVAELARKDTRVARRCS